MSIDLPTEMIKILRDRGYAVAIFSPEEMEGVDPFDVESEMIEKGWDWITNHKEIGK
jgi:hypothetical protein